MTFGVTSNSVTLKFAGSIAALLVLATALLCPALARAENDHLIVPWRRIGPVVLGMTTDDVVRVLGEPTQQNRAPYVTVYNWKDNLSVTAKTDSSYVTQVCALSPDYATAQGLRPGLPDTSVRALMGEPQNSRVYHGWWKLSYIKLYWGGLMVNILLTGFDNDHSVQSVCVNHNE
jgi:outer membrane protein assembly factor BamE (lipoprotein component of BamABCDE complex)